MTALVALPDNQHALSGSHDNTVKLFNVNDGAVVRTFTHHSMVRCLALHARRPPLRQRLADKTARSPRSAPSRRLAPHLPPRPYRIDAPLEGAVRAPARGTAEICGAAPRNSRSFLSATVRAALSRATAPPTSLRSDKFAAHRGSRPLLHHHGGGGGAGGATKLTALSMIATAAATAASTARGPSSACSRAARTAPPAAWRRTSTTSGRGRARRARGPRSSS